MDSVENILFYFAVNLTFPIIYATIITTSIYY